MTPGNITITVEVGYSDAQYLLNMAREKQQLLNRDVDMGEVIAQLITDREHWQRYKDIIEKRVKQ